MSPLPYALLADLLTALETDGSAVGPDLHLRLQALVRQLPQDTQPEDLKTLLAPVLCKSKEEQERFYELFARSWARVKAVGVIAAEKAIDENPVIKKEQRKKWWQRRLSWGLWVALGLVAGLNAWAFFTHRQGNALPRLSRSAHSIRVGEQATLHFDTLAGAEKAALFSGAHLPADSNGIVRAQLDSTAQHLRYTALGEGIDSLQIQVRAADGNLRRQHTVIFNVLPATEDTIISKPPVARDNELYQQRPLPYPRDLSRLLPPQATPWQQFLADYAWPIKISFILFSGLLLSLLAYWLERRRKQLIAEHQPNAKPPYIWNIHLAGLPDIDFGESFYSLLHLLRRREADEQWRLDMPQTIRATIRKGGLPNFRYSQQTRPAEYLLLIDRQGARDHRARLFEALFQAFRAQEVIIDAYYFDSDPRLCWNEEHPQGLTLRELYYQYPQSRLLLLGSGWSLLNPQTGRLAKWTKLLGAWTDRAILTPQPLPVWSRNERALRDQFLVLPAALSGLRSAVDYFDADDQKEPDLDPRHFPDAAASPIQLVDNDLIKSLQLAFRENKQPQPKSIESGAPITNNQSPITNLPVTNSPITTWVAACAIYPELHWDLTLYLGHLLSTPEQNLLTAGHLAELCRLPWLVEGKMPKEARELLLGWLEREQPARLLRIREALHLLLAQNPPPSDSVAHDEYALNMALNEWLITRDRRKKKQLEKEVALRLAAGQEADFTVIKMLDRPRGPLDFVVPKAWRRFVYAGGRPGLGLRAWWWAGLIWLGICGVALWWQPAAPGGCSGKSVIYKDVAYCLNGPEDQLLLMEVALTDAILDRREPAIDSILVILLDPKDPIFENYLDTLNEKVALTDAILDRRSPGLDSTMASSMFPKRSITKAFLDTLNGKFKVKTDYSFPLNICQAYFNSGVYFHALNKDSACLYFHLAQKFNLSLPDTAQLWYVRSADKICAPDLINSNSPPPLADIVLRGQMLDVATNSPIPEDAYRKATITAKGLPPGYLLSKGQFRVDLPGRWSSPVYLTVSAPGYQPTALTVPANGFRKNVVVRLTVVEKCLEGYLLKGQALVQSRQYEQAIEDLSKALLCSEVLPQDRQQLEQLIAQAKAAQSITDSDGDGVPESTDKCPNVPGPATNAGCPEKRKVETTNDKIDRITDDILQVAGLTKNFILRMGNVDNCLSTINNGQRYIIYNEVFFQNLENNAQSSWPIYAVMAHEVGHLALAHNPSESNKEKRAQQELAADLFSGKILSKLGATLEEAQSGINAISKDKSDFMPAISVRLEAVKNGWEEANKPPSLANADLTATLAEINQNMVTIPAGTFTMGCDGKRDGDCYDSEKPAHQVALSSYAISKYEVTQRQWQAVMGSNPSAFKDCPDCPVEQVSWNDVQEFLKKLNQLSGKQYRLPTEAEWEYAARGGAKSQSYLYSGSKEAGEVAWYSDNSADKTHPVGGKNANELGLYDMSGNVWEWCADWYATYSATASKNPTGPAKGVGYVFRGGSWFGTPRGCRAVYRSTGEPTIRYFNLGLRLVLQ